MQRTNLARFSSLAVLSASFVLIFCYSYFVSRHRILWSDELFGWMLVTDPSWRHMLRAWNLGADGGGIGFYTLCRLWLDIFGRHVLAFRAFSAAGVFAGFAGTWFTLRRFYRPAIAAIPLFIVWFDSRLILWQVVQTRFYGMLLGLFAWALYLSIRSAAETDAGEPSRRSTLAITFAVNLLLASTHPFGVAYSALVLVAAFLDDLIKKRKRAGFYASAILPWSILLFSLKALENSARVGKPWFWTTKPSLKDLGGMYFPDYAPVLLFIALWLGAVVVVSLLWRRQRRSIFGGMVSRSTILIPAMLLMAVPVVFFVVSHRGTSYFVDRYMCPFLIAVTVLGAELLTHVFARPLTVKEPMPFLFATALTAFAAYNIIAGCLVPYKETLLLPPMDFTGGLASMLPRDEPILIERPDVFDLMAFYRNAPDLRMYTPVDWPIALEDNAPRWIVSANHEMENWKLAGYYSDQIVDSATFLNSHSRFVVVEDGGTPWFQRRIASQPGWHVSKLGVYNNSVWTNTIWQVTR